MPEAHMFVFYDAILSVRSAFIITIELEREEERVLSPQNLSSNTSPMSFQVFVHTAVGKKVLVDVSRGTTAGELKRIVTERTGVADFYLVHCGKVIRGDAEDGHKNLSEWNVQANATVNMIVRMHGGGNADLETIYNILAYELEQALDRLPFVAGEACSICLGEEHPTLKLCHQWYCRECLCAGLKSTHFKLKCIECQVSTDVGRLVPELAGMSSAYNETVTLLKNADVAMCRCGTLLFNDRLRANAICPSCRYNMCFFCGKAWDRSTMSEATPYQCGAACSFAQRFNVHALESFQYGGNVVEIPTMRFCPKCFTEGAYDMKCKFHRCSCGHRFCFLCLKPEDECKQTHNFKTKCVSEITWQCPWDFPHLVCQPRRGAAAKNPH